MVSTELSPAEGCWTKPPAYPDDGSPIHLAFTNAQHLRLHCYIWHPVNENNENLPPNPGMTDTAAAAAESEMKEPRGMMVIFHGFQSHARISPLYKPPLSDDSETPDLNFHYKNSWVEKFNSMGLVVAAMDFQGHGLSDGWKGKRCVFRSFDDLVEDAFLFLTLLRKKYLPSTTPLFTMGTSMGACVLACLLARKDAYMTLHMTGCCLLGPMFSLETRRTSGIYPYLSWVVKAVSYVAPTIPLSQDGTNEVYPWLDKYVENDPLVHSGGIRARTIEEMFRATDIAQSTASKICHQQDGKEEESSSYVPHLLVFHNKWDPMCEVEGTLRWFRTVGPSSSFESKELFVVNSDDGPPAGESPRRVAEVERLLKEVKEEVPGCCDLQGVDVSHSMVSDPDASIIREKIVTWVAQCLLPQPSG